MRILIAGGAGFIGANLVCHLHNQGHTITVLDNLVRRGSELNLDEFKSKGITFVHGDLRNVEDWYHIKTDLICDCSAQPSACAGYENPKFDITNNLYSTVNILEYCRLNGSSLIFWATNKCYDQDKINSLPFIETETRYDWPAEYPGINEEFSIDGPNHSVYGMTKLCSDLMIREYVSAFGIKAVINRFSCLAGPGQWGKPSQGWLSWFVLANYFGLPYQYIGWQGKQLRDCLFIPDICRLVDAEIERMDSISGEVFCAGGDQINTSLLECTTMIETMTGRKSITSVVETARMADHRVYRSDVRKAKRLLNWEPKVGMEPGLESIYKWVIDNEEQLWRLYA